MTIAKSRRKSVWVTEVFAAAVLAAGMLLLAGATGDAEAHQPDFLRISQANIPEPPCTFWHDDTCETASSPPPN